MDPDAAYRTMMDDSYDDEERYDAAEALAEWINHGGFLPAAPWSTAPGHFRRSVILSECADIIERTS